MNPYLSDMEETTVDVDQIYLDMFEMFAYLHPHEAYDLHKDLFCNYVRKIENSDISDEEIKKILKETDQSKNESNP